MNFCRFLRLISVIVTLTLKRQFFTLIYKEAETFCNSKTNSNSISLNDGENNNVSIAFVNRLHTTCLTVNNFIKVSLIFTFTV